MIMIRRILLPQFSENAVVRMCYMNVLSFTVSKCSSTSHKSKPKEMLWKYKGAIKSIMADCCNRLCSVFSWNEVAVLE
jgi:hypothetical protein